MADLPSKDDAAWLEALRGAHAARAELLWRVFDAIRQAHGADDAERLVGGACRAMGLSKRGRYLSYGADASAGAFCTALVGHSEVAAALFDMERGPDDGPESTAILGRCVLVDGWRALGLPPDEIALLCRAAREIDHGTMESLGLEGRFDELISEGGSRCRLVVRRA
jgi:hypothetical protein